MKDYKKIQIDAVSFEEENPHWNNGQKKSIESFLIPIINNNSKILDAACGDGSGLEYLSNKGYTNIYGVDINKNKLERASLKIGNENINECNISNMPLNENEFDKICSSHTLKHSIEPFFV